MNTATRILILDDDPTVLEVYSHLLRANGYEVRGVSCGQEGLRVACDWRPDVVLLDVMLPDLSGLEVCRQIKTNAALPDTFVVLFSGHATSVIEKVEGLECGADEYLAKTTHLDELLARLRTIVRLRDATAALRASEQHYRQLVEIMPEAVGVIDLQGRIITANHTAAEMLGYDHPKALPGKSVFDLTPPEEHERVREGISRTVREGPLRNAEYTLLRRVGDRVPVELSATASTDGKGQAVGLVIIARDISERERLEKELMEMGVNERRRIGHELHDGLGQYLAGIAFRAKALEQALAESASPERAAEAKELAGFISNAISQTRSLAHGLDSSQVETSGLLPSLQDLVSESQSFFNITCTLRCANPELRVEARTELALYRVAQEAVHNAVAHGKARKIEIELAADEGVLRLRIQDDGTGFDVRSGRQAGMGLRVMQYRARSIGARLTVSSEPGRGTEIRCDLPRAACQLVAGASEGDFLRQSV